MILLILSGQGEYDIPLLTIANQKNLIDIAGTCLAGIEDAGPMFLRVVRATVSKGVKREYVRLVEAYRDRAGKTQHRTILNLGRKDLLAAEIENGAVLGF